MQTDWGFSRTELKVAMKVLNQIADRPQLLDDNELQNSGIQRFFAGVDLGERPMAAKKEPDSRSMSPGRAAMMNSLPCTAGYQAFLPPNQHDNSPCRHNPGLASLKPGPKRSWARDSPPRAASPNGKPRPVTVMPDYSAALASPDPGDWPSGATKYSAGQNFKRTECTNHKYGGGGR